VAISIAKDPTAKKVVYYHQGKLTQPRIGYLLEKEGKVFLTAVGEDGTIRTFHYLQNGWQHVHSGTVTINGVVKRVFYQKFDVDQIPSS
jgi:hypothetical protein